MLELQGLKVRSLSTDFYEVSWRVRDTIEDLFDYTFQVQRSESSEGPWENVSVPFADRFVFRDTSVPTFNNIRTLFYRIATRHKDGEEVVSEAVDNQPDADLITLEVRRHMGLLLREFAGRRCWVLPVRTFGQRCTSCWNATQQKRTRSGCFECFDTGFTRGYHAPIETWMQLDPGQALDLQPTNVGLLQQMNTTARVVDLTAIKPRDVVIEAENRRWRVTQVNQTEHGRAPIHMELQLHEIPKSDIEYKYELPLKEELRDLSLSPLRNFVNPHNLENFENTEMRQVFDLYNYVTKREPR